MITFRIYALLLGSVLMAMGATVPTFHKDVAPILQNRCHTCHRPGEIGPMAFLTYAQTRPWAKSIKEAVATRSMPPWYADKAHGHFANDRSLSEAEIETLRSWADSGAKEGDPKDAPAPRTWVDGWSIPKPDLVVAMPSKFPVPAKATVDYQYIVVPTGLTEDRWVQIVEARPSARQVVHHAVIFIRDPESKWLRGEAQPGVPFVPPTKTPDGKPRGGDVDGFGNEILTIYTPGNSPYQFRPGEAKLLKAGSDLVFQMHYTSNGKPAEDLTSVGMIFAKEPPIKRVVTVALANSSFKIPPGDPNYRVPQKLAFRNEGTLLSFFPHMHLRGKGFEVKFKESEAAAEETLLKINNYNFNWQLTYKLEQPISLKPGARIEVAGYFDNSPNNKYNPDPKAEVRWGEQSWEEMMIGFFDVAVDPSFDRRTFLRPPKAAVPAKPAE